MILPVGNRRLNELFLAGENTRGLVLPEHAARRGQHWPYIILVSGPPGFGKSSLSVSTACRWAASAEAQKRHAVIYVTPHQPAPALRDMMAEILAGCPDPLSGRDNELRGLKSLEGELRKPPPKERLDTDTPEHEWIGSHFMHYFKPLRDQAGDGAVTVPGLIVDPLKTACEHDPRARPGELSRRRFMMFIDSFSPVADDNVRVVIETLRHPDRITDPANESFWRRLAVLWIVFDGSPELTRQLEHLAQTVIRFDLEPDRSYWSPCIEVVKTPQVKIHGRHQVKLRVRQPGGREDLSHVLEGPGKQRHGLAPYGIQLSGWLEVWHSMPHTLWKTGEVRPPCGTAQAPLPTAFPELDAQLGQGLRPRTVTAILGADGCGKRPLAFSLAVPWCVDPSKPCEGSTLLLLFRDSLDEIKMQYPGLAWERVYALRLQSGAIRPEEFLGLVDEAIIRIEGLAQFDGCPSLRRILIDDVSQISTMFPLCARAESFLPALFQRCAQSDSAVVVICSERWLDDPISFSVRSLVQYVIRNRLPDDAAVGRGGRTIAVDVVSAPGAPTARAGLELTVDGAGKPSVATLSPAAQPAPRPTARPRTK